MMLTWCIILTLTVVRSDVVTITRELFSNSFIDTDVASWTITGNGAPTIHKQYTCNGTLLFGGYNLFIGDPISPISISKTFPTPVPHWSARIRATLYKIDSWNSENLFVTVDGRTQRVYTWSSTFNGTDICGYPNPIIDSLNPSYSDGPVYLDLNISHSASTLTLGFSTNINSWIQSWGIRYIIIYLDYCDRSCSTCDGSSRTQCLTCDSTVVNSISTASGTYFNCTCQSGFLTKRFLPCTIPPCLSCTLSCGSGYYPDMVNSLCIKCHAACLSCIGPVNNPTNCTSCASGYWSSSNIGPCSNCFQGCKTCNGLTATSCLSCSGTYFFLSINNSCVTSCPPLYYSSESLNLCISCDVTCLTCDGSGSNYCTSCQSGRYLDGTQCITLCLTPLMGFTVNNTCVSQCPYTNFIQTSDNTCRPCPTNCGVCVNTSYCVTCINNGIFYNNLCVTSCAGSTFSDGSSCQPCHSTCLTCSSNAFPNLDSTYNSCLSCPATTFLYNNTCYTLCPSGTFTSSTLCIDCHPTCLTCSGPSDINCILCNIGFIHHLNTSKCISDCPAVDIINNDLMTCWSCNIGYISYLNYCKACDVSCLTCSDVTFYSCLTCSPGRSLVQNMCYCDHGTSYWGISCLPSQQSQAIPLMMIVIVAICLIVYAFFKNRTVLLSMVEFMQSVSYMYYISIKLYGETPNTLLAMYNFHPSYLIKLNTFGFSSALDRYAVNDKTGLFLYDAGYVLVLLTAAGIIFGFFILMRKILKDIEFWGKIPKLIVNKLNPYIFSTVFSLVLMESLLAATLNIINMQLTNAVSYISLILMILVATAFLLSFFWKIEDTDGVVHYALLYNYYIDYRVGQSENKYHESGLKAAIPLLVRLGLPILVPIFNRSPLLQSCIFLFLFLGKFICLLTLKFKRKFQNVIVLLTCIFEICCAIIVTIASYGGFDSIIVYLTTVVLVSLSLYLALTIMQVVVNYRLFPSVIRYLYIHIINYLCYADETKE